MRVSLLAVGRMKSGPERELYSRFAERFSRAGKAMGITGFSLIEIPEAKGKTVEFRRSAEAVALLNHIPTATTLIALDETGNTMTSHDFATTFERWQREGNMAFALGGPDGHGAELLERAQIKLSLGPMTFPHQIARILLMEQLYRAVTILGGHPYHRP